MTETYNELGGQADANITARDDFITMLPLRARRYIDRSHATAVVIGKILSNGWPAREVAAKCGQNLPSAPLAAQAQIGRVLAYYADRKPPRRPAAQPGLFRAARVKRHDCSQHADKHQCPWLNETTPDGKAIRCSCATPGGAS